MPYCFQCLRVWENKPEDGRIRHIKVLKTMAGAKEAKARIKINKLLQDAGWRFFDDKNGPANIQLELNAKINENDIDALGNDFETTEDGFIDFLLLDAKGFPLAAIAIKIGRITCMVEYVQNIHTVKYQAIISTLRTYLVLESCAGNQLLRIS